MPVPAEGVFEPPLALYEIVIVPVESVTTLALVGLVELNVKSTSCVFVCVDGAPEPPLAS